MLIEVCVDSEEKALAAIHSGRVHRIELCSQLELDGLTADFALIPKLAAAINETAANVKIHVMIRPVPGAFVYHSQHIHLMKHQIAQVKQLYLQFPNVVTGVVFGLLLHNDCEMQQHWKVDVENTRMLCELAKPELSVTFHRAFDLVAAPLHSCDKGGQNEEHYLSHEQCALNALSQICAVNEHGLLIDRILTNGGGSTLCAYENRNVLKKLVEEAKKHKIIIIPGGKVRSWNVEELMKVSGATEVHSSTLL